MASFANEAAWLTGASVRPLKVGPGPTPNPDKNEVVIKVAYVAVNPVDCGTQEKPYFEMDYPVILGTDVAGTIVQLGSEVTRFKLGQRVIGHCDSLLTRKKTNAGFQLYTTCREILVSQVPDSLPLANAAVLPLSISTAASALFVQHNLPFPSLAPQATGKKVLVWGGSSSVGCSVIQLARAAGFEVATTASRSNHDLVRSLGASYIFDYNDSDVVEQIAKVIQAGDYVVACIANEDAQFKCGEILKRIGGGMLPVTLFPHKDLPENVNGVFINGLDPGLVNLDVGDAVWRKYIPEALAAGNFQVKPDPQVIFGGLEKVQEGIDVLRKGVSAKKVVIEISKE